MPLPPVYVDANGPDHERQAAQKRIDQDIEHQVKDYTEALAPRGA